MRQAQMRRQTAETNVFLKLVLDGEGIFTGATGVGFFDHMLSQIARHGGMDLTIQATGDLHVDAHHLVEDCGIVLGAVFAKALGDKKGIERFGSACVPMDDALSRAVVDLSGRPYTVFNVTYPTEKIGDIDVEVFREFFIAFANNAGVNVHIENLYGENAHHIAESCFKAFARALKTACNIVGTNLPSTKGTL